MLETATLPRAARTTWHAGLRSLLLRVAGAALLLFAIARMFDLRDVWRLVRGISPAGLAVILALTVLSWLVGIIKWKALLASVSMSAITAFYFLGQLYSLVLPGQLAGEAVKTARLAARGPGLGHVGASVVIDRLTSLVGLGLVSGMGLWLAGHHSSSFAIVAWMIWTSTLAFVVLLFAIRLPVLQHAATRFTCALHVRGGRARRLARVARRFVHAWRDYGANTRLITLTLLLAIAFQLANVAIVTAVAASLGVPLPFKDTAWVVGLVSIMTLVPVSFGGVGVREAGFVGLLGMIGIPAAEALSVSLICSLIVVIAAALGLLVELHWLKKVELTSGGR